MWHFFQYLKSHECRIHDVVGWKKNPTQLLIRLVGQRYNEDKNIDEYYSLLYDIGIKCHLT
jgi:hypothetical protein